MGFVRERAATAYAETLEAATQIQAFGTPSDAVVETLRAQAGAGVPLAVHAEHPGDLRGSEAEAFGPRVMDGSMRFSANSLPRRHRCRRDICL
jgi:hypothetical protein